MKSIVNIFTALLLFPSILQAQMVIQNGATFKTTGAAVVTLQDVDLQNNGILQQDPGGKFIFSGSNNNIITPAGSGYFEPIFDTLEIAKTGTGTLALNEVVQISGAVKFTSGIIDLAGSNINLTTPWAVLLNESETSRITGASGGYVSATQPLNAPNLANPGNLGAIITSNENLGSTTIRRGHAAQVNGNGMGSSINRYYDITPTNNSALGALLSINYFTAELNAINENELVGFGSPDNTNWTNIGGTVNAGANRVDMSGIDSFVRTTLASFNIPLPLSFTHFHAGCAQGNIDLSWVTAQETNVNHFEIEYSSDGIGWHNTGYTSFIANTHKYNFKDERGEGYYRIAVVDNDNRKLYSDVQHASCNIADNTISLWPNPATDQVFIKVAAATDGDMFVKIYDSKGSFVKQQDSKLLSGDNQISLNLNNMATGIYWLTVEWNNGVNRKSVKVVKR